MISEETLTAVHPIVDQLCAAGYAVRPLDNSILAALNHASYTPLVDTFNGDTGFIEAWLESLSRAPVFGGTGSVNIDTDGETMMTVPVTVHGSTLDEAVKVVAGSVKNALKHARSVAKPAIESVIDNLNERIEEYSEEIEPFEIVDVRDNDAWSSSILVASLTNFKGYRTAKSVDRINIPKIEIPEEYTLPIATGSQAIDKAIRSLFSETGKSHFEVVDSIFNGTDVPGKMPARYYLDKDIVLLKYLVCNILADNPLPDSGLDGRKWTNLMTELSIAYGINCYMLAEIHKRDADAKILFYGADETTGKLYLNGNLYDKWLESGGSPELIYGAYIGRSSHNDMRYDVMLENKDINMRNWTMYHTSRRNKADSDRKLKIKRALMDCVVIEIGNLKTDFYPPMTTKTTLIDRLKDAVAKVNNHDLRNIGKLALNVVCDVMFYHTPAKELLVGIGDKVDEGFEPDEAASAVAIEYIANWVVGSLVAKKL